MTLCNVYEQWRKHDSSPSWCATHYVHHKSLKKIREVRQQLVENMEKEKIQQISAGHGKWDQVRKAICSGYFHNAAKLRGIGEYVNLRTSVPCHLHPTSSLYGMGHTPDYVVYHEVVLTAKEYMHHVTAVDPYWLGERGPMFFKIKKRAMDLVAVRAKEKEEQEQLEEQHANKIAYEKRIQDEKDAAAGQERLRKRQFSICTPGQRVTPRPSPTASPMPSPSPADDDEDDEGPTRRRKAPPKPGKRIKL